MRYRDRIDESLFPPQVDWRKARNARRRKPIASTANA
jgi:hypothetical protein